METRERQIKRMLQKLETLWLEKPDQRFGQLISNLSMGRIANGLFDISDARFERTLEFDIEALNEHIVGYEEFDEEPSGGTEDEGVPFDRNWT